MSLKCSLFGHRYGDTEVRRDREQDGNEFVETVQELKVCARCGEELVISETTEVTTVEAADNTAAGAGADTGGVDSVGAPDTGRSGGTPQSAGTTGPPAGSGAGPGDVGGGTGSSAVGSGSAPSGASGGPDSTDSGETGTADRPASAGGGSGDAGGRPAEAPGANSGVDASSGSPHGSPEGDMPPARKDDAVILDDDEDDGAEWPDESAEETDDWEPETEPDEVLSSGSTGGLTVPEGEFYCPECGFTTPVESSSLREGDFCPECHRGALEHRSE